MRDLSRILVAMDQSLLAKQVWAEACALAKTFGSKLYLVHAVLAPEFSPRFDLECQEIFDHFQLLRSIGKHQGVDVVRTVIRGGQPAQVILSCAAEIKADLILLGAGTRGTIDRLLLGTTAEQIARDAEQPVWIVRHERLRPHVERIFCAVDASESAREALATSIFLARTFVAPLTLRTVVSNEDPSQGKALQSSMEAFDLHGVQVDFQLCHGDSKCCASRLKDL